MKKLIFYAVLTAGIWMTACGKKDAPDLPPDEDILNQKIEDIIPQEYLDTLKMLGLEIHMGTTPPQMEGSYMVSPSILDTSNVPYDYPGKQFLDGTVHLSNQSTKDFGIDFIANNFLKDADTSITTAISGYENYFTVYGKVKATSANGAYAITAMIITGEKVEQGIKDFKVGVIVTDDSHADASFIEAGQGRIIYDADFITEQLTEEVAQEQEKRIKQFTTKKNILSRPD